MSEQEEEEKNERIIILKCYCELKSKRDEQKIEFNIFPASHTESAAHTRGTLISYVHGWNIMYLCNAYYYKIYANQDNKEKQATSYEEIFCAACQTSSLMGANAWNTRKTLIMVMTKQVVAHAVKNELTLTIEEWKKVLIE